MKEKLLHFISVCGKVIGFFFDKLTGIFIFLLLFLPPCLIPSLVIYLIFMDPRFLPFIPYWGAFLIPLLVILLTLFENHRKRVVKYWCLLLAAFVVTAGLNYAYILYDNSITVNTSPSINVQEYLPFQEDSKIVVLDQEASLQLSDELPVLDGAAAVFPVYSAFVNAVYPDTTELNDGIFEYNNTVQGYKALANRETDIFFGAYPSQDQIDEASEKGTAFVYTPIGTEAFVFFVNKDNPVDNLSSDQIRKIYSGEITNWKEVGGNDEEIIAYQRNQGSGSQSMLIRFMDGYDLMEAPTEKTIGGMLDIVNQVSDYRNKEGSIGFSFRYYLEGIIQNPDIKLLSIDGIAPTVENIQNGTYPITTALYAVTYEGNDNKNVALLLEWVLSEEGQKIIEKTGYVPLGS